MFPARQQLVDANQELVSKVKEAQARVRKLQEVNLTLKTEYDALTCP